MDEIEFYIKYVLNPLIKKKKLLINKNDEKKLIKEYESKISRCFKNIEKMIDYKYKEYQKYKDIKK